MAGCSSIAFWSVRLDDLGNVVTKILEYNQLSNPHLGSTILSASTRSNELPKEKTGARLQSGQCAERNRKRLS